MRDKFIRVTSKDHGGETVYLNLEHIDMVYADDVGGAIIVMAGWERLTKFYTSPSRRPT